MGTRPAPSPQKNFNTAKDAQLLKDGRIVGRRPTRVLRNKRENIYIGTWNVLTMLYKWKPQATRPKGRPRLRWDDDVRDDLRKMGVNNWKQKAQVRKPWRGIIEQTKTHTEL